MKIFVRESNAEAIRLALFATNKRAHTHTFTTYADIVAVVKKIVYHLTYYKIPKYLLRNMRFTAYSGRRLPKSYIPSRTRTRVVLQYSATGFYITECTAFSSTDTSAGTIDITYTGGADHPAIDSILRTRFTTIYTD